MDIWVISIFFWLWRIILLWIFTYTPLHRHVFSFLGLNSRMELLGQIKFFVSLFKKMSNCFPKHMDHSHQQCLRVPVSPHLCQHLMLSIFLIRTILEGVYWYLTVPLIFISLRTKEVEHIFMCLFTICLPSSLNCLFKSSVHFLLGCSSSYQVFWSLRQYHSVLITLTVYILQLCCSSSVFHWPVFNLSFHVDFKINLVISTKEVIVFFFTGIMLNT